MAAISGQATTFNRPQFTNEVLSITPAETAFLTMIGGTRGGKAVFAKDFSWSTVDNRAAAIPAILEGANAPTAAERSRTEVVNTVQIYHEALEESYTALAAALQQGPFSTRVWAVSDPVGLGGMADWQLQIRLKLEAIARDMNLTFLTGTYSRPANNSTARVTQGILGAITTNVEAEASAAVGTTWDFDFTGGASEDLWTTAAAHGLVVGDEVEFTTEEAAPAEYEAGVLYYVVAVPSTTTVQLSATKGGAVLAGTADATAGAWVAEKKNPLTKTGIDNVMRAMADNGARRGGLTVFSGSYNRTQFSSIYGYAPESRMEGGVSIERVLTDFGTLDIVYDRQMPKDEVLIADLNDLEPRFLEIPGKGHLFMEPLAKVGSAERAQIYGEAGLWYGWEGNHAKITGLTTQP